MRFTTRRFWMGAVLLASTLGFGQRSSADYYVNVTINNLGPTTILGTLDLTTGQYSTVAALPTFVGSLTTGSDGSLIAGLDDGHLYTVGGGSLTRFGSGSATLPAGGTQYGYYGLANLGAAGFIGLNENTYLQGVGVDKISSDGNTVSSIVNPIPNINLLNAAGALARCPDGQLYMVARSFDVSGGDLFRLDPTTGIATEVNQSGLGTFHTHDLALVTVGGQLYGIDSDLAAGPASHIYIYTINTVTGKASMTGAQVTGLPDGFNINAAAAPASLVVPEPSSLAMMLIAGLGLSAFRWNQVRRLG